MNYEMKKHGKQITKTKVYFNQNISRQRLLTASTSQKSETKDLSFVLIYHLCFFFFLVEKGILLRFTCMFVLYKSL